jgi:hypothetical protein
VSSRTTPLLVVQTFVVRAPADGRAYEVQLAPDDGADAPRMILHTERLALYTRALELEGTSHRVIAHWHREDVAAITRHVLDRLEVL